MTDAQTAAHTPGPLAVAESDSCGYDLLGTGESDLYDGQCIVATVHGDLVDADPRANAARLALCWNSHDALLDALRTTLRYLVTPTGLPDKGKGRTAQQQATLGAAVAAIALATA